jgi:uncharacterized protein (TIRG00374 family)
MPLRRKLVVLGLGPALSAAFLWIALRNVDLGQSWATLRRLDPAFLAIPVVLALLNFLVRAWRWQLLFPASSRPGLGAAFRAFTISIAANNLLPGRAGDLARCVLIGKRVSLSDTTVAAGTLVVEKLLDGLAVLAVVACALRLLASEEWLRQLAIVSAFVFGGALVFVLLLRWRTDWVTGLLHRAASRRTFPGAARLAGLVDSFAHGITAVTSPSILFVVCLLTAAIWATEAALFYVFGRSLGISLAADGSLIAAAILGLGLMVPAAPGALGTYEFFGSAAVRLVGVAPAPALALVLLLHAWVLVFNTAVGLLAMAVGGVGLSALRRQSQTVPEELDGARDSSGQVVSS